MHKIDSGHALDEIAKKLEETERELEECRIEYRLLVETCLDDFRAAASRGFSHSGDLRRQFELTLNDISKYCGDACDVLKCRQANAAEVNKAFGKILAAGRLIAHLHRLSRILESHEDSSR